MGAILLEGEAVEAVRQQHEVNRELSKKRAQTLMEDSERVVQHALENKKDLQTYIYRNLSKEVSSQSCAV